VQIQPDAPVVPIAPGAARPGAGAELSQMALQQFAAVGFAGTSLQQIAASAGYSKSSVLYHFASKEALLAEVLTPAIERLEAILGGFLTTSEDEASRRRFVEDFVDFLLKHRLEVHVLINQAQSLKGIPVIDRARALIVCLGDALCHEHATTIDRMRFGVALGGAAYSLVAGLTFFDEDVTPADDVRPALIVILTELLAPVAVRTSQPRK
jgi:TetR/AcrR family transcriptional regulator